MTPVIILAAGFSSRMRRFKPLLPLGAYGKTVIECTAGAFLSAGLTDITVVAGHRADELTAAVKRLPVKWTVNSSYESGMFSSVQRGVASLDDCEAFFMLPADIPLVRPSTIIRLEKEAIGKNEVLIPTFKGKDGHPTLISSTLKQGILSYDGDGGLENFFKKYANVRRMPSGDEGTLLDCDFPEDYERLRFMYLNKKAPTYDECTELMESVYQAGERIVLHCRAVEKLALYIADLLNLPYEDKSLLSAASLLHDIARRKRNHAAAGAELIRSLGWDKIADIVGSHMDIEPSPDEELSPAEILFLSDKLIAEDKLTCIEQRFAGRLAELAPDTQAEQAVRRRLAAAETIAAKLERKTGRSLSQITESFERVQ